MSDHENTTTDPPPFPNDLPAISSTPASGSSEHRDAEELLVSTKKQLQAKLEYLATLGLLGFVPPARVNAAHGCLRTVLQNLGNQDATLGSGVIADEDALTVLRKNPVLLKLLKPLLTPQQLELIIREAPRD